MTPVPRVLLSVTLAGPTPSDGAGTSRLCRGRFHPSWHLPGQAAPSYLTPAASGTRAKVSHLHSNHSASWRTAVFTDSPLPMLEAEAAHRRHAIIEQVIADLKAGPLAHLPSASFTADSAWLVLARDRVQPDPGRRMPGLNIARQSDHRHHPPAAAHRPGPHHPLSPPADPATPDQLALARRLATAVHRRDRTTSHSLNPRPTPDPRPPWKRRAHRPHSHDHSPPNHPARSIKQDPLGRGESRLSPPDRHRRPPRLHHQAGRATAGVDPFGVVGSVAAFVVRVHRQMRRRRAFGG
jgi:hypothetical protein